LQVKHLQRFLKVFRLYECSNRIKEEERLRLESKVKELELKTDREKRNDEN